MSLRLVQAVTWVSMKYGIDCLESVALSPYVV